MRRSMFSFAVTLWLVCGSVLAVETKSPEYQKFLNAQQKKGFSKAQVEAFLKPAKKNKQVLEAIRKPWEAKPWHQYYPIFITSKRIEAGAKFWRAHEATITRASKQFQVNPEVIVAIIGVETFYGTNQGSYNIRDALYSLAFFYPPRSTFFMSELGFYMDLVSKEKLDPKQAMGSYAGAMGFGQFIASSYLHYAVDFNGDGRRDLFQPDDAIGSVANYFHKHGWVLNAPVVYQASVAKPGAVSGKLWQKKQKPNQTVAVWQKQGVKPTARIKLPEKDKALLFKLEYPNKQEYWLGMQNFYVITRYNHSELYAMAVYQLSQEIKKTYEKAKS
jgi:membrane-bound lytic murein transglycosylase B